ncbi:hypothetical protein BDV12DRAFT_186434 [Aspergillus spectabilis]
MEALRTSWMARVAVAKTSWALIGQAEYLYPELRPQPQTIRRKACTQCVTDKTRCNLDRPSCSRCSLRQISCHYPYPTPEPSSSPSPERDEAELAPQPQAVPGVLPEASTTTRRDSAALVLSESGQVYSSELLGDISSALVSPKTPVEGPSAGLMHHSMDHLGDSKSLPLPLANCFTLVKMWHGQCQGAGDMVNRLIENEVNHLLDKAVTIYLIILLFPHGCSRPTPPDANVFRKVQDLAYAVFHNVQSFNCRELGFMPAPAAKILWQAQTKHEWNSLYIKWSARWDGHGMDARAERWLEETDEFGMIMISIGECHFALSM